MARIRPVDLGVDTADLDPAKRAQLGVGGIISHRPEVAAGLGAVTEAINHNGTLPGGGCPRSRPGDPSASRVPGGSLSRRRGSARQKLPH